MAKISETALLVNWSKAKNAAISKDRWAHLWVTKESARIAEEYTEKVVPGHPLVPALRNRFFVDALQAFEKKHEEFTFINLAAGFTSYPYLISPHHPVYEIELPHVIAYRKKKIKEFEAAGQLPKRKINFLSLDLNEAPSIKQIEEIILNQKGTVFVLMEGLLYYLTQEAIDRLFGLWNQSLPKGSQLGFVTWPSAIKDTPAMKGLRGCFEKWLQWPQDQYTWIERDYFSRWDHLKILEETNYLVLEKKYCNRPNELVPGTFVDESVFLMEKS
ncbi:MAG: class I SAM-dependent methyltransferase [Deltaproteobacteria bacterium]|nr:class I SAM-dependent methyltransferase [Deltaproteobacteria bacterium]